MPRRSYPRSNTGYRSNAGKEAARRHVEAAAALSRELGGSDEDVKSYFFALRGQELDAILGDYRATYGQAPGEYAEDTLPAWRSGRRRMSGMVAERLFALLPPRMPLAEKYKLTESLWRHVGPRSRKVLRVGTDVAVEVVAEAVQAHVSEVVVAYAIPESMEHRFNWLAAGDVAVKQQLLNHVRREECRLAVEAVRTQFPVLVDHLRGPGGVYTSYASQTLRIGKHELQVIVDPNATGVIIEEPHLVETRTSHRSGVSADRIETILFWGAGLAVVAYFCLRALG